MNLKIVRIKAYDERAHVINEVNKKDSLVKEINNNSLTNIYASRLGAAKSESDLIIEKTLNNFCQIHIPNKRENSLNLANLAEENLSKLTINQEDYYN